MIGLEAMTVISSAMVSSASLNLQVAVLAQFQGDARQFLGLERVHADRDRVGPADFDGRDVVKAIHAG